MTPRQIEIVQDSCALIVPHCAEVAELVYDRLFELAPQVRPLFNGHRQGQGAKLMQVLTIPARSHRDLMPFLEKFEELASRDVRFAVRNAHFAPVVRALILALREALGEAFTIEFEEAWVDVCVHLISRTTGAADEIALAA